VYETLTDRASAVLLLATEEAQNRSSEVVDSGDMLVALLVHGGNPGAEALQHAGVRVDRVRRHLASDLGAGAGAGAGDLEEILRSADEAAGAMGHSYVGPEHLLIGLLRLRRGRGLEALAEMGVSTRQVESEIISTMAGVLPRP
jgi:ATP-dependent Clp protease ATP-binding subunit ClpC